MTKRTAETFTDEDRKDRRLASLEYEYAKDKDYHTVEYPDGTTHYIHRDLIDQIGKDLLDQMATDKIVARQDRIRSYLEGRAER